MHRSCFATFLYHSIRIVIQSIPLDSNACCRRAIEVLWSLRLPWCFVEAQSRRIHGKSREQFQSTYIGAIHAFLSIFCFAWHGGPITIVLACTVSFNHRITCQGCVEAATCILQRMADFKCSCKANKFRVPYTIDSLQSQLISPDTLVP